MAEDPRRDWKQAEWLECRRTIRHLEVGLAGVRLTAVVTAIVIASGASGPQPGGAGSAGMGWVLAGGLVAVLAALDLHWTRFRDTAWLRSVRLEIEGLGLLGTGLGTESLRADGRGVGWPRHALAAYALAAAAVVAGGLVTVGAEPGAALAGAGGAGLAVLVGCFGAARLWLGDLRRHRLRLREVVRAEPFFTADEIATAVTTVAGEVTAWLATEPDRAREPLVLVAILHGARYFVRDLVPLLGRAVPVRVVPMRVTSAPGVARRTAPVLEYGPLDEAVFKGRRVLIVDDILDSGVTIQFVREQIQRLGPTAVRTAVFLKKFRDVGVPVDFVACDLGIRPDSPAQRYWFFGYGMDADGDFRDLPVVGAVVSDSFRHLMDKADR